MKIFALILLIISFLTSFFGHTEIGPTGNVVVETPNNPIIIPYFAECDQSLIKSEEQKCEGTYTCKPDSSIPTPVYRCL